MSDLPENLAEMIDAMPPLTTFHLRTETLVLTVTKLRSRILTEEEVRAGRVLPEEDESTWRGDYEEGHRLR